MAAITYGAATELRERGTETNTTTKTKTRGALGRFWDAMIEARMRQAARELRNYRHLMPAELEQAGAGLNSRCEDELPFIRR